MRSEESEDSIWRELGSRPRAAARYWHAQVQRERTDALAAARHWHREVEKLRDELLLARAEAAMWKVMYEQCQRA